MLKRLEMVGFKSFADRTAFDFADGLTGIIGPNGSGKSNVVDAVRWVLGEQSAKSLRGGEMTDVIFNGSTSRRTLGMAEVAMVFDNSKRQLASQADEVRLVRRVYRSGESEYLLNGEPCRLKDIKDVLLGSGAGTDAYCIIEQGRVDLLLQAAPKERRTIFEEAAGISRFKARKTEAERRLARVAENMVRLRDILDEVEKQLRAVNIQASKALRHQEHSTRLRIVREGLSLREYDVLAQRFAQENAALEALRAGLAEQTGQADNGERELGTLESRLGELDGKLAEVEADLTAARQVIAAAKARREGDEAALTEAEEEMARLRERLATSSQAVRRLEEACRAAEQELKQAEEQSAVHSLAAQAFEEEQSRCEARWRGIADEAEEQKAEHLEQMRQGARLSNDTVGFKAELDNLTREHGRLRARSDQATETLATIDGEMEELAAADHSLQAKLAKMREGQSALKAEREELEEARDEAIDGLADLRAQRSGLTSRIEVLEGLERSHEGLGTGAREVLEHLQASDPGPWRTVVGLVAEAFTVRREYAPLIDLALGDRAQRFLVADMGELARALAGRGTPLSGRASFFHLGDPRPGEVWDRAIVAGHPGLVMLAQDAVRCEEEQFASLPERLLDRTLIVRDLSAARAMAELVPGCRCVTLAGELLEPDGTLTVGTHHAEGGILSRRSELRELRLEVSRLDERTVAMERELGDLREQASRLAHRAGHIESEIDVLMEQLADMRWRITQKEQQREGLSAEVVLSQSEMTGLGHELERLHAQWEDSQSKQREAEARVQAAKARLEEAEREMRELEAGRGEQQRRATEARVRLAQVEERASSVRERAGKAEADRSARHTEVVRIAARIEEQAARIAQTEDSMLRGSSVLAQEHLRKAASERCLIEGQQLRDQMKARRHALAERVQSSRATWREQQEAAHARELSVKELSLVREALCQRLREDYGVELTELHAERVQAGLGFDIPPPAEGEPIPPEEEIADLRRKLARLGSVNLEAIAELAELETRHAGLKTQYDDLEEARGSLEGTIGRINTDCRKLFSETFDAIQGQFRELFRKLFGGGMADIVLEEGADVLDAGIEVVAKPPGKELRSISLMSGGEKTMTAVALLLAIFRSKPSPFCILDEVDAALDEANVGRFTGVLREFAGHSQFILITHHKRTMAAADVLYGVTMSEPGVSSRFSVRYEDWPDDEKQAA